MIYYSDIFNLSGKYKLSGRSDLILFWQPELRYYSKSSLQDTSLFLQDLYLDYAHEINEKTRLVLTDRYRYSDQAANTSGRFNRRNEFSENIIKGSVKHIIDQRNAINTLISYTDREYERDSNFKDETRDYDQYTITPLYSRNLNPSGDTLSLGISYTDHALGHGAGGVESATYFLGYDRVFNPQFISSLQLGHTEATIDQVDSKSSDSSSPFFELGVNYKISEKTALNASYGYSLRYTTWTSIMQSSVRICWYL